MLQLFTSTQKNTALQAIDKKRIWSFLISGEFEDDKLFFCFLISEIQKKSKIRLIAVGPWIAIKFLLFTF